MSQSEQNRKNSEIESKFPVPDLSTTLERLKSLNAELVQDEMHERNVLFDTTDQRLLGRAERLRLRQTGGTIILTYKRTEKRENNIAYREEIETNVSDFDNARLIFERLGYQPFFEYEKFRSTYQLEGSQIMLDRTPIGSFIEIEGADEAAINAVAQLLGLDENQKTDKSYTQLFEEWRNATGYAGRDMVFK